MRHRSVRATRSRTIGVELGGLHGLVNLGGDVRVFGPHADGQAWRIAVQDPRGEPGTMVAHLNVPHGAMATSGDYERYFEHDQGKFHQNRHLQSILWQDKRVKLRRLPWPPALKSISDELIAHSDR